jgi:galactonate dehydratase
LHPRRRERYPIAAPAARPDKREGQVIAQDRHRIRALRATVIDGAGERSWLFVEVETASGLVGAGECSQNRLDGGVIAQLAALAPAYLGRSPLDQIEAQGQRLRRADAHRLLFAAVSALEQALWDLCGQLLGVPVYQLLGGSVRDRVRLYANLEVATRSKTPEEYAANAARAVAEGFTAVKLNPFRPRTGGAPADARAELALAVERVRQVRAAVGPGVDLLVDFLFTQDAYGARRAAEALAPYDLFWIEEPFALDDPALLAELRRTLPTRLAGGEQLCGRAAFRPLLEAGAFDVLMPDVKWIGGILEAKKVAAMAESYAVAVAPHNLSGPISTAASVHLAATLPNFLILEYCWGATPWRAELVDGAEVVAGGHIPLPARPGLGVGLNRAVLDAHRLAATAEFTEH